MTNGFYLIERYRLTKNMIGCAAHANKMYTFAMRTIKLKRRALELQFTREQVHELQTDINHSLNASRGASYQLQCYYVDRLGPNLPHNAEIIDDAEDAAYAILAQEQAAAATNTTKQRNLRNWFARQK